MVKKILNIITNMYFKLDLNKFFIRIYEKIYVKIKIIKH